MFPSVLTSQIRRGVEDFLQATFPPSNRVIQDWLNLDPRITKKRDCTMWPEFESRWKS